MNPASYGQLRRQLLEALNAFLEPLEAQAEASCWLEEGLGRSRSWLAAHGEEPVGAGEVAKVEDWLDRRRRGEPWAYLVGWAPFRGRRFRVTPATLIPRPETEGVLEAALDVGRRLGVRHATDVGTGSGILAVSLALATDWRVAACDLSSAALAVAQDNAAALGARVSFHQGDLLDPVPDPVGLVVANLPYVDPADERSLQPELRFEPRTALFAADRGLALTTRLLAEAWQRRCPGCVLEIGAGQGAELCQRALAAGWRRAVAHQDLAGLDRVLLVL
jgi:release factor glutamine methyltransferase